MIGSS